MPRTTEHVIQSKIVPQVFTLKVLEPMRRADGSERFPVLYATDSDDFFGGYATAAGFLQHHGEVPRFILVGIGYENPRQAAVLRMRDLFTHAHRALFASETRQIAESPFVAGISDVQAILQASDAAGFLQFIRTEAMPFIAKHYAAISDDNNFFGYSAGGSFGAYTLFTQPDTFKRYILGSPATSYGGRHFGIELAKAFIRSGQRMNAKVFMSVGELEELKRGLGQLDLVTGYYLLAKFLRSSAIPGLDLTLRMFPGETHASAWAPAFIHGLKALFGAVDQVPYWPEYLK
jgi:predicted alpha/beta superfamily hydrolase